MILIMTIFVILIIITAVSGAKDSLSSSFSSSDRLALDILDNAKDGMMIVLKEQVEMRRKLR